MELVVAVLRCRAVSQGTPLNLRLLQVFEISKLGHASMNAVPCKCFYSSPHPMISSFVFMHVFVRQYELHACMNTNTHVNIHTHAYAYTHTYIHLRKAKGIKMVI